MKGDGLSSLWDADVPWGMETLPARRQILPSPPDTWSGFCSGRRWGSLAANRPGERLGCRSGEGLGGSLLPLSSGHRSRAHPVGHPLPGAEVRSLCPVPARQRAIK